MLDDWRNEATLKTVMNKIGAAYEVLNYLGGGGSARVYKIHHKGLDQVQILKIMDFTYILNIFEKKNVENIDGEFEKIKNRFIREAKIYRTLMHCNIVKIYDIDFVEHGTRNIDIPYLIMEYIEGKTLKDFVSERGHLDLKIIFRISRDVLSALNSIHQKGIIHRDIKPTNIMIRRKSQEVVILDFGIAKNTVDAQTITDAYTSMGTFSYTSPEMLSDSKTVTPKTDIYSFGIVLYEMITGELPFKGSAPEVLLGHLDPEVRFPENPRITGDLNRILKKALAKEPEDRYDTAAEFLNALKEADEIFERIEIDAKARESIKRDLKEKEETLNNKVINIADAAKKYPKEKKEIEKKVRKEPDGELPPKKENEKRVETPKKENGYKREFKYIPKDHKRNFKYIYITAFIGLAIAAFFFLKSYIPERQYDGFMSSAKTFMQSNDLEKANEALNKAKKIKDTQEIEMLLAEISDKRTEGMKRDFDDLKAFWKGTSSNNDKLQRCREYLDKHEGVPANNEKTAIFSEINNSISNLTAAVKHDEDYQNLLSAAGEYIKKGDYPKAVDTLERAKKNRGGITGEIAALSNQIREKQIAVMNGEQYQRYMDTVKNLIKSEDYEGAKRELDKARKINNSNEVKRLSTTITEELETERKNGEKEYKAIKAKINLSQYQAFQGVFPNSIHLRDLKERLKAADKNLPPDKYWDKPISKNGKGFYEITFGSELNGHRMIYIPEKKIWIDKYEVSWGQFRKYLKGEKRSIPSTVSNEYINNGDGFPAVVTYEEAEKYCKKYGFQLPNKDEWEYVAGKGSLTYPWGNESPDTPTSNSQWRANLDTLDGAKDKDGYKGTAPVKSFEPFSSPFGAVNMAGNVWEWIQGKALKGGGYLSLEDDLRIENVRQAEPLDKEGFRCMKAED